MIVITGATGNVGGKIVSGLLARGQKVKCIARTNDRLLEYAAKGAEISAGSLDDTDFITKMFEGADAVFVMVPPNYTASDFRTYQNRIGASVADAISRSGVKYVVNLSSQGAHLPDKTGPIKGLHDQEERLNNLGDVNILHLRPTYFMENLLVNIPMIKNLNMAGSAISGDRKFAMIATKDIADHAVHRLTAGNFSGKTVQNLLGQRDLSMNEAFSVIGKKIDKPDLKYVQFPYADAEKGLIGAGLSADVSRLFIEMSRALNEGLFAVNIPRTPENTTATSIEEFADIFARIYFQG